MVDEIENRDEIVASIPDKLKRQFHGGLVEYFGHALSDSQRKHDVNSLARDWDRLGGLYNATQKQFKAFYEHVKAEYKSTQRTL